MKKFASLGLALVMCMGLATTAFAAESYTYSSEYNKITFDSATITKETLEIGDMDTGEMIPTEVDMVIVTPGSSVKVEGELEWATMFSLEKAEDGNGYFENPGVVEFTSGKIDSLFEYDNNRIYVLEHNWATGNWTCMKLGAGVQTSPAQPAEPETPAKPEQPTQSEAPTEPTTPVTPATPAEPTAPATPAGTYTVKKGDTYGTIALNNYGTYGVWNALAKANNYAKLTADTQLVLPEKLGKYARIDTPVAAEGETLYTVKAGDTLGAIAKTVYGDVMKYKTIFERNADRFVNANTIYEGQVIVLPAK